MQDTIFAPLTIRGRCSIYVLRISGEKTSLCLEKLGVKKKLEHRVATVCLLKDRNGLDLDEALSVFFRGPNSFTGEDVCEINLHCSSPIIGEVIYILNTLDGVRLAENGEFSKRAFLNGKFDLLQAEAIADLVDAKTELQHRKAMEQLRGKNSVIFEELRADMVDISSNLEVFLDFPEDDVGFDTLKESKTGIASLIGKLESMLDDNNVGLKIKNGINISIVGKVNTGKSSLMNFLAGDDVAIVSDIAGTTRDVLEMSREIAGIPVRFSDTAGLRETTDEIETEGIRRALLNAENADFRILVLEPGYPETDPRIASLVDENTIVVLNKIDLPEDDSKNQKKLALTRSKYPNMVEISLKYNKNTEELLERLEQLIYRNVTQFANTNITQERHRKELRGALDDLKKIDLDILPLEIALEYIRHASLCLGRITGRIDIDEILDSIFEKFCIGK
ncbi:MAG: tRNA uridine-5-carboxymethylaminomethyl(34) synthesis GTPase MnmE [Rickettsiales bacterium]|jgi:tRNA modification GTPase|nr:tRNA uridine-5-carboxymethylaminomethyl(34) synthesis GTPase MnmE [Rickettsiales bacterium]